MSKAMQMYALTTYAAASRRADRLLLPLVFLLLLAALAGCATTARRAVLAERATPTRLTATK